MLTNTQPHDMRSTAAVVLVVVIVFRSKHLAERGTPKVDVCPLPLDSGPCKGYIPLWGSMNRVCQRFIYVVARETAADCRNTDLLFSIVSIYCRVLLS